MTGLALAGALFLLWLVLVFLFTPGIRYHLRTRIALDAPEFLRTLVSTCQSAVHEGNRVEVLTNGAAFYPAMLEAIGRAERTISLECYIFEPGRVAAQFIDALGAQARRGVTVTVILDAIGSAGMRGPGLGALRDAGVRVEFYQRLRWYSLARFNNRTHRELLVIDGRVAFTGGAGIADWWSGDDHSQPAWRDTMVRVEGPVVAALQGVVAENWLECCGEILTGDEFFPKLEPAGDVTAFVVKSSPSDRATVSRVTFQMLIESARRDVLISTPYFLPDKALRVCLMDVARRGVRLGIVVPGAGTDQRWVRLASRRGYKGLLTAGVRIFEYRPAMTHCKMLLVDDSWAVVGTTNVDNRSFEHNDEVNLALCDNRLAARLRSDHERDVTDSDEITLERWVKRPWWEKVLGPVVWILERQQ
ncbi:MAG: phospholipase D-like domain-containing protein [Acidobacteriota bacterium]|nr:phospholipase D-like domain-containing protein [Acidobacteriota bacterium]